MSIAQEFKQLPCISKMTSEFQTSFFKLAEHYGKKINDGKFTRGDSSNGILFTLHDFDHHCCNLYAIISRVIFNNATTYSEGGIKPYELYILNLAVLFHDISMATDLHWKRSIHSKLSSDYLQKQFEDKSSPLGSEALLQKNDVDSLKLIIKAHSDIKDGSIEENKQGIKDPNLKDVLDSAHPVRARMLAGILRIADELDITTDRLGGEFECQLKKDVEADGEAMASKHWELLHYFKSIKVNAGNLTQIDVVTDDEYLQQKVDQGDLNNIIENILDKRRKLNRELSETNSIAFVKTGGFQSIVSARTIEIETGISDIAEALTNKYQEMADMRVSVNPKLIPHIDCGKDEAKERLLESAVDLLPKILNDSLSETIKKYIENQGLFKVGHFRINDKYCSRDWIDTHEIIETERISKLCVEAISDNIKKGLPTYTNCILLGLDIQGTLLASKIAFQLQIPFSYIIPVQSDNDNSTYDKKTEIDKFKEIIIITDAIATWETVNAAIQQHKLGKKVVGIYTVLYRRPNMESVNDYGLFSKTFSLNCDFGIEIMEKAKCTRTKCLAQNNKVK